MARPNEHGSSKRAKLAIPKLLEMILDDVLAARAMPADDWRKLWPNPFTSMAIPAGAGREQPCTQAGINAAYSLAKQTWDERGDLRQRFAREPFDRLVFNAIGMTLTACPSHLPPAQPDSGVAGDAFYEAVARDYADYLELNVQQAQVDLDRHIPCHLFDPGQGGPSFEVGPVYFRTREDWIGTFLTEPEVLAHVRQAEADRLTRAALTERLLASDAGSSARVAWDVLMAIWGYSWIATARLGGHELTRSHDKAATIIGLAIDAIGLRFHLEDARRLAMAGSRHPQNEDRLATTVDGRVLRGSSVPRLGLGGRPGSLADKMAAVR